VVFLRASSLGGAIQSSVYDTGDKADKFIGIVSEKNRGQSALSKSAAIGVRFTFPSCSAIKGTLHLSARHVLVG